MIAEADNVSELKKMVDVLLWKEQVYQSEINILQQLIKYLQDQLFGRKSEKKPPNPEQIGDVAASFL